MPFHKINYDKNFEDLNQISDTPTELQNGMITEIQNIWFKNFNWENLNIKESISWNNIWMQLIAIMESTTTEILLMRYAMTLFFVICNEKYDINAKNDNGSTLLDNIIAFNQINILKCVLKFRKDIDTINCKSQFWNTYIDLAVWWEHYEIAELLEEYNN